jgi:hypothetical protein
MSNLLKRDIAPDPRAHCRVCGAMSYRRMIARDANGRLTANGLYQCTGCSMTFSDPRAWHMTSGRTPSSATGSGSTDLGA